MCDNIGSCSDIDLYEVLLRVCFTIYGIRPNYGTVHLGFSELLGTLSCGKICIYLLRVHLKKFRKGHIWWWLCIFLSDFLYKGICGGYSFELHQQVNAIQMSTHNIFLYKEVDKKYTGYNLKTTELLHCALIGVCVVIRLNTVIWKLFETFHICRLSSIL